MSWSIRILLLVGAVTLLRAADSAWVLPPVDGSLTGTLESSALAPGAPALRWRAEVVKTTRDVRHAIIAMDGAGTRIRGEADINLVTGITTWKVTEGSFDLSRWEAVISHWIPAAAGLKITGTLSVTSNGVVQGGHPTGEFVVSLQGATIKDSSAGWRLEGVSLNGRFAANAAARELRTAEPLSFGIQTITTQRFGARNLSAHGTLRDLNTFLLTSARVEIAGGTVTVAPSTIELQPFRAMFDVMVNRIGLQDVAALVPTAVAEARGRVDGEANIGWSSGTGLILGKGSLTLRHDEPAIVRLAPSPGLITDSLPPAKRAQVLKYYPGLQKIELGQIPIQAEVLDVTFTPQGDQEQRTATVHLAGSPADPKMKAPIDLVVNVRGPLDALIKLGTDSRLHFGGH